MFSKIKYYVTPILIILHTVGFVGISFFPDLGLKSVSELNLIVSFTLILLPAPIQNLWKKIGVIFLLGMSVEILGVATGYPFGNYHYGDSLGTKIFDVPLIIGVNWFMSAYISYHLAKSFIGNTYLRILVSTLFMLILDILLEPIAPKLGYWYWENGVIPTLNYVSWSLVGLACVYIIDLNNQETINRSARNLFFIQLIFFVLLNLFLE